MVTPKKRKIPPINRKNHPPSYIPQEKQIRSLTQNKTKTCRKIHQKKKKKYDNKSHTVNYIQINHQQHNYHLNLLYQLCKLTQSTTLLALDCIVYSICLAWLFAVRVSHKLQNHRKNGWKKYRFNEKKATQNNNQQQHQLCADILCFNFTSQLVIQFMFQQHLDLLEQFNLLLAYQCKPSLIPCSEQLHF